MSSTRDQQPPAEPVLPEPVRQRIINLVAALLGQLPPDEVPAALRKVARFAPNRRARLGGPAIAAQLSADQPFRARVSELLLQQAGELGVAVREGTPPAAADPTDIATLAYLARPAGWRELIEDAGAALATEAESAIASDLLREVESKLARAEHDRSVARAEAEKLRDELARTRDELKQIRDEGRSAARELRQAQAALQRANEMLAVEKGRATKARSDAEAEARKLRGKLTDAQAAMGDARHAARDAKALDEARLWLLLETVGQAAAGLRRELGLDPARLLPADAVATAYAQLPQANGPAIRAQDVNDPARLAQLLALPKVHLLVDGYNVTKRGFAEMSLEQQRSRLVAAMGLVATQTGAEVTVVFDGAERVHGLPPAPRGVRVLFSRKGETADELIRRLVRAEPAGRPVVVVSSDKEVADGVKRHGAYPMSSDSLLARITGR